MVSAIDSSPGNSEISLGKANLFGYLSKAGSNAGVALP